MAGEHTGKDESKWAFDSDHEEALSLSDLPLVEATNLKQSSDKREGFEAVDFEFSSWGAEMCAADDVFFQGQILPLRPSVSSENGLFTRNHSGSRAESMDKRSSENGSFGFNSRSISSSSSSYRSRSSSSSSGNENRISNSFYTHPSPKPQLSPKPKNLGPVGRRTNGWAVFRLGVVRAPEIELQDLRHRKSFSSSCRKSGDHEKLVEKKNKNKNLQWFISNGLNCKCSTALETVPSTAVITRKRKEEEEEDDDESGAIKQGISQSRTFEWLRELSIAEAPES